VSVEVVGVIVEAVKVLLKTLFVGRAVFKRP
jgi:hypothetical protein